MARTLVSRSFDYAVTATGLAIGLGSLGWLVANQHDIGWKVFLAVPVIALLGGLPTLIGRTGGGIEIGMDSCVLVFLAYFADPIAALAVWSVGVGIGQGVRDKRGSTKLFNIGLGVLAGGLALFVLTSMGSLRQIGGRELLAIGLAAAAYFLVDFTVSGVSLSLEEGTTVGHELAPTGALMALVAFMSIMSLGYLAAVVVDRLPPWACGLLVLPLVTILVASRTQSRGAEHARRLRILLDAAARIQTVTERSALLDTLTLTARDLLRDHRVQLRDTAPSADEIGVRVRGSGRDQWIVCPALNRARSTTRDDQQGLTALVALADDAFARLRLVVAMSHLAWYDPMTSLGNRSLFMDRLSHALEMQNRRPGGVGVLFCDLDGFKRINDLFGHAAGDALLVEVGKRIKSSVRSGDTIARLGGDEFAVLLEDVADTQEVQATAARILEALRRRVIIAGDDLSVTVTIGLAMSELSSSADALLSHADLAMYHGKSQGRDRCETYRLSFGDERRRRIELVGTLRAAIHEGDLEVVYQPVIQLKTGDIMGVEALVRWRRGDELISPDLFIPTAEESGLIVGLGDMVIDLISADAPRLRAAAGKRLSIGINISVQQLQDEQFADRLLEAWDGMGDVQAVLELTERAFVTDHDVIQQTMTRLADADVRFAIDDFGVGFSAIGYLQRLPVRILKVDKSFLATIEDDPRGVLC